MPTRAISSRSARSSTRALAAGVALAIAACDPRPDAGAADSARARAATDSARLAAAQAASAGVPAYLQPVFRDLDTLLAAPLRDSLRALTLDSAYRLRSRIRGKMVPMDPVWVRTPIGDTVIARGEQGFMTTYVVIDLYQQHLRGEPLDIAGALRRISPEYVESRTTYTMKTDSVLLLSELDGAGGLDRLVRESRRQQSDDAAPTDSAGGAVADGVFPTMGRLALYLGGDSLARAAAWALPWDDLDVTGLQRTIALPGGGSLLVIGASGGDADESVVVLTRRGETREVLRHQIDYGEGSFEIREANGRVLVDATGDVQLGDQRVGPKIVCSRQQWAGSRLAFDEPAGRFVVERSVCLPRR